MDSKITQMLTLYERRDFGAERSRKKDQHWYRNYRHSEYGTVQDNHYGWGHYYALYDTIDNGSHTLPLVASNPSSTVRSFVCFSLLSMIICLLTVFLRSSQASLINRSAEKRWEVIP